MVQFLFENKLSGYIRPQLKYCLVWAPPLQRKYWVTRPSQWGITTTIRSLMPLAYKKLRELVLYKGKMES